MFEPCLSLFLSSMENDEEQRVLTELYEKYQLMVCRYIRRHFPFGPEDVNDCVQQSYLNVARNIRTVVKLTHKRQVAYLLKAAYTVSVSYFKKNRKIPIVDVPKDKLDGLIYAQGKTLVPSAEDVVEDHGCLRAFHDRLVELTPAEQIVFQLYFIEGISREELAKCLNVSTDSVRAYISRTKAHVKKILGEVYYGR